MVSFMENTQWAVAINFSEQIEWNQSLGKIETPIEEINLPSPKQAMMGVAAVVATVILVKFVFAVVGLALWALAVTVVHDAGVLGYAKFKGENQQKAMNNTFVFKHVAPLFAD